MRDVQRWRRRRLLLACVAVGLVLPTVAVAAGTTATRAERDAMSRIERARQQAADEAPPSRVQPVVVAQPADQPAPRPTAKPEEKPEVWFAKNAVRVWPELPDNASTYHVEVRVTNHSDDAVPLTGWVDFNRDNKQSAGERTTANVKPGKSIRRVKLTWKHVENLEPGKAKATIRLQDKKKNYPVEIVPAPDRGCDTGEQGGQGKAPSDYGDLSRSAAHPRDGLRYAVSSFGSLVRWDPSTGKHASTYPDAVVPQGDYDQVVFDSAGDLYAAAGSGKVYQLDLRSSSDDQPVDLDTVRWGRPVGKPVLGDCMRAADFGDAPGSYATKASADGPAHRSSPALTLGRTSSAEPDAVHSDLGDDAIGEVPPIEPYTTQYTLTVPYHNVTNAPATLAGWLDANLDKKFSESERRMVVLQPGDPAPELRWPVDEIRPSGTTYVRLRLYAGTPENPSPEGFVDDRGEVEDYPVGMHSSPISNLSVKSLPVEVVAGRSGMLPVVVRNSGPDDSDLDAMVTVTPPNHVTFGDPPSSCAANLDGTVSCRLPADRLPASGDPLALQLPFDVDSAAPSEAALDGGQARVDKPRDPDLDDNTTELRISTKPAISDVSTHLVRAPKPVVPGEDEPIQLRIDNAGPADTADPIGLVLRLPDAAAAGDSLPAECEATKAKVTCAVPAGLAAGGHRTYDIPVRPDAGLAEGADLGGGEIELSLDGDPADQNNHAAFALRAKEPVADLVLSTRSDSRRQVPPGGTFPVTVKLTNRGPSDATHVTLAQSMPTVLRLDRSIAAKGCTTSWNRLDCKHGVVHAGETVTVELLATLAPTYTGDGSDLVDSGFVNTATREANLSNNATRNGLPTAGVAHARVDLRTSVTAPKRITPGTEDSLAMSVHNLGPSDTGDEARQVVTMPESVTASDLQPKGCVPSRDRTTVNCQVPAGLAPGSTYRWRIPVQVSAGGRPGGVFADGRVVTRDPSDPNPGNNRAGFRIRAGKSAADLVMTKRPVTDRPVGPGRSFAYELSVTNSGPSNAANVVVRDRLPQALTYLGSPDGCELRDKRLSCPAVDLGPGEFETYRVEVKLDPRYRGSGRTIAALASVSSDVADPDTANNESELRTSGVPGGVVAHPPADLALLLTSDEAGDYELTVHNNGPNEAVHQTISGFLPAAMALASSPDGCVASGQRFTCPAVESLAPGESVKRRISVRRSPAYAGDGSDLTLWSVARSYSVDDKTGNNVVMW